MPFFTLEHTDGRARAGIIETAHGTINTPMFMPVGTQGTVKTIDQQDLEQIGAEIILGNTYHLHLRPGEDLLDKAGGLHKFMRWDRPILTDSGGFQVFSLGKQKTAQGQGGLTRIDEEGVTFQSHIDGSTHRFTPEIAIDIEHKIGADIIMAFDECTPDDSPLEYATEAMNRTHRWAKRCVDEHQKDSKHHGYDQYLFGIIQGANHKELREQSAKTICSLPFDGIAIGGESIGYNMSATADILDWVSPFLPEDKPRYTMGVGLDPADLLAVMERGADMFDCVAPTRLARHGTIFTKENIKGKHRYSVTNAIFAEDYRPLDEGCLCPTCRSYTRAYIHHLFSAEEITGMRLATVHNLWFMIDLMKQAREAILNGTFKEFKERF